MSKKRLGEAIKAQGNVKPSGLKMGNKIIDESETKNKSEKRTAKVQATITPTEKEKLTQLRGYQSESDFVRNLILNCIN